MPYVWVDDSEFECDGNCDHSQKLMDGISYALDAIRDSNIESAVMPLGLLCNDAQTRKATEREKELKGLFEKWRAEGRQSGFLDWTHDKRKASRT